MDQSIHCFSLRSGTCALSVQKIYFYFMVQKTIVYSFKTRFWQAFERYALKPCRDKGFNALAHIHHLVIPI